MTCRSRVIATRLILLAPLLIAASSDAQFEGRVVVEWLMHEGDDRLVELVEPFEFKGSAPDPWVVPAGARVDGASIPPLLWSAVGSPFVGDYRYASVVHDYFCDEKTRSWEETHRMFYEASVAGGVSALRALAMYGAVYAKGPRWRTIFTSGLEGVERLVIEEDPPGMTDEDFRALKRELSSRELSLEEVERWVTERAAERQ